TLLKENPPSLHAWLLARKPASGIEVLRRALGNGDADSATAGEPPSPAPVPNRPPTVSPPPARVGGDRSRPPAPGRGREAFTSGGAFDGGARVSIELEALRKHTAIFAGSGSGKTVLIRRIIEECALAGVSAIVLDPNNALARLGDPWPEPPTAWG